jgi:hypothetical protein
MIVGDSQMQEVAIILEMNHIALKFSYLMPIWYNFKTNA